MTPEVSSLWSRAKTALATAQKLVQDDPDAAASRAYYAAFYAVSALFTAEGRHFTRHSGVEAAVHRDLVKSGRLPEPFGERYSALCNTRMTGDYGGPERLTPAEAQQAADQAGAILDAIRGAFAEPLP